MYSKLPNLVIGFHGCSKDTYERVIFRNEHLIASSNTYDWLGNGIYFWGQNCERAKEWAINKYGENDAFVVGAVLDLGHCLNLTDYASADILRHGYRLLKKVCRITGNQIPQNRKSPNTDDILLRDLDCAVIQQLHYYNEIIGVKKFDSVRGVFIEGNPVFPGSEIMEKTHTQLCICNPNCIKGYFSPLSANSKYDIP